MLWGLFYANPNFNEKWSQLDDLRKNRVQCIRYFNWLQKNGDTDRLASINSQLVYYTHEYAKLAHELYNVFFNYAQKLLPVINEILKTFIPKFQINIEFYPGWDIKKDLVELLLTDAKEFDDVDDNANVKFPRQHYGLHLFDLRIKIGTSNAKEVCSGGERKLIACAMKLAQGEVLRKQTSTQCIYLIDDLAAELDTTKQLLLAEYILKQNCQVFITYINSQDIQKYKALTQEYSEFRIENGELATHLVNGQPIPQVDFTKSILEQLRDSKILQS